MKFYSIRQAVFLWVLSLAIAIVKYDKLDSLFVISAIAFFSFLSIFFITKVKFSDSHINVSKLFISKSFASDDCQIILSEKVGPGVGDVFFLINSKSNPSKANNIFLRCKVSNKTAKRVFAFSNSNRISVEIGGSEEFQKKFKN